MGSRPARLLAFVLTLTTRPQMGITSFIECPEGHVATYNGICLPATFPPRQNYSRNVPHPPYLHQPPPLVNITVGRQLFVDDFLVQNMSASIKRTFHTAEYYEGNPVLVPDQPWEVKPISTRSCIHLSDNLHYALVHRSSNLTSIYVPFCPYIGYICNAI